MSFPFFTRIIFLALLCTPAVVTGDDAWKWQNTRVPDPGFDLDKAAIHRVTTLESKGSGSLRAALEAEGPRIVVFEIAGVIDLDMRGIRILRDDVVIAGQTAPNPGITLIRGGLGIGASRVLIQHIAIRPGDAGQPKGQGWEPDGITTLGNATDVWIDHCSVSWSVDENLSVSSYKAPEGDCAKRIHIRNCIIAEGLNDSTHGDGPHSKGTLVHDGTRQVAIVGNLYASNVERNPVFKPDTSGVVVNNVITNPGQRAIHASVVKDGSSSDPAEISIAGNLVLFGPETKESSAVFEGHAQAWFDGNEGFNFDGGPIPLLRKPFKTLPDPPLWPVGLRATKPSASLWKVIRNAGARPAQRDPIDQRILEQSLGGIARIIDSQEDVGGYPRHVPVAQKLHVPPSGRRMWLENLAEELER